MAIEHKIRKSHKPEGEEGGEARELLGIFMGSGLGFGRGTLLKG